MVGVLTIDQARATATLRLPHDTAEFLLHPQLVRGFGSYGVGLDRGQPGPLRFVTWRRTGGFLALVQLNARFLDVGAAGPATRDSFAQSVIFRAPIRDEDGDGVVIDVTELALMDFLDIANRLPANQSTPTIDHGLSWLAPDESFQHESGIELTAYLTLTGTASDARRVSPDPGVVTLAQRLTLLPLPGEPQTPRRYHVVSGGYGKRLVDLSLPQNHSQESGWQPRFRLERTQATTPSTVRRPIVFSVDPEIPEPWRSAVVEGANWWQEGFAHAGFIDAFHAEVMDARTDAAQAGVNPVWWVHRADRGPSFGNAVCDPRTGEILKGNVRLGSQRLQQLTHLGEALLSPYGRPDEEQRLAAVHRMVVARIRHLAAHEIGHALGFMHNFASHLNEKPSVMDYPFPALALDETGEITLDSTYSTGLSEWDVYLVRSAYEQFPPGEEASRLDELRRSIVAEGHRYLTDDDGNSLSGSSPDAVPWVFGADAIATLDTVMKVRTKALADFTAGAVPPGSQTGELEKALALIHLLHRYQTVAVARLLGGVHYAYGDAADPATSPLVVSAGLQHRALESLTELLAPSVLAVPDHVADLLAPPSTRFSRTSADFAGHLGPVFDPLAAAAAAATVVCQQMFEPSRLNRLVVQQARDAALPGAEAAVAMAFDAMGRSAVHDSAGLAQVADTARSVVVQHLIDALRSSELHASCRQEVAAALTEQTRHHHADLSRETELLLSDPSRPTPWIRAVLPEGWPL